MAGLFERCNAHESGGVQCEGFPIPGEEHNHFISQETIDAELNRATSWRGVVYA